MRNKTDRYRIAYNFGGIKCEFSISAENKRTAEKDAKYFCGVVQGVRGIKTDLISVDLIIN